MVVHANSRLLSFFFAWFSSSHFHGSSGNFKADLKRSEIFQLYLDRYVYPTLMPRFGWLYERIFDKDLQNKGIDLILDQGDKVLNVDEKAQIEYMDDKNIPTMAFEISYIKDRVSHFGWLFDPQKRTDLIFYVTDIKTRSGKGAFDRPEDILSCSIYCIELALLVAKLKSSGLDYDGCIAHFDSHQVDGVDRLRRSKLVRSYQKAESPLNLVIHHSTLQNILKEGCLKIWGDDKENN